MGLVVIGITIGLLALTIVVALQARDIDRLERRLAGHVIDTDTAFHHLYEVLGREP